MSFRKRKGRSRFRSRKRRHGTGLIAKAVRASLRAQTKRIETQHAQYLTNTSNLDFKAGDGTSTVVYVCNPFAAYLLSSGAVVPTSSHAVVLGTKLFLRGVQLKMRIYSTAGVTAMSRIDLYMISAKQKTWPAVGGVTAWDKYTSGTTAITVPTRAAGQSNIPLFETSTNGGYTGISSSSDFDTNDIKIIKRKKILLNTYGQSSAGAFKIINAWFPINKFVKLEDPAEGDPTTAPVFFKWRQYYFVIRVFNGLATDVDATQVASVDANNIWIQPYWKNDQ